MWVIIRGNVVYGGFNTVEEAKGYGVWRFRDKLFETLTLCELLEDCGFDFTMAT